jgi:hypothetical protein
MGEKRTARLTPLRSLPNGSDILRPRCAAEQAQHEREQRERASMQGNLSHRQRERTPLRSAGLAPLKNAESQE